MPLLVALLLLVVALPVQARQSAGVHPNRVRVEYWDKWTGFEKDAMQAVVDDFNRSQDRIVVEYLSIGGIVQKTLIATAGGNPPDVAGCWANDLVDFAEKNALVSLDELARGTIVRKQRYLPVYWNMAVYQGTLYGVPSTPGVTALHWNKRLFREAGLDPERPPRTFAELDEFAERLTKTQGGKIEQVGFLPSRPPWWPFFWVYFFDGRLWDGGKRILLDAPENVRAFEWVKSYADRHGVSALQTLSSGFGNFASAQNPFMSEKLAMVFQGVWLANYIDQYAPHVEWGAAPMPVLRAGDEPVTYVDSDMLVIPRGARHPREAFTFLEFVSRQESTETLNRLQRKNSPLREVSDDFYRRHEHPYIRMFQELASSPRAIGQPRLGVWGEYRSEIENVFQRVWLGEATPERALADGRVRIQKSWDRMRQRKSAPPSQTLRFAPVAMLLGLIAILALIARRDRRGRRSVRANASLARGLSFFSPWGVGLFVFIGYPVFSSLVFSFCDYSVLSTPRWVGLQNFADLVSDEVFWIALKNSLLYVALALPLGLFFSFLVALALDANVRGSNVYRTLVFVPSLTPVVASSLVWLWMFNAEHGVLNDLLGRLSFGSIGPVPWLADRRSALPSIVLMSLWSTGHTVLLFLAAMRDVPNSIYEAADIDGASWWRKVWHVTLPMTSPVIYFNAIMGIIAGLQLFTQPFLMTGGGPARATLTYTMRLYDTAFTFMRMGYASAMAWILFLVILGLTLLAVRAAKNRVHYAAS